MFEVDNLGFMLVTIDMFGLVIVGFVVWVLFVIFYSYMLMFMVIT